MSEDFRKGDTIVFRESSGAIRHKCIFETMVGGNIWGYYNGRMELQFVTSGRYIEEHIPLTYQYDPSQQGDRDDDI